MAKSLFCLFIFFIFSPVFAANLSEFTCCSDTKIDVAWREYSKASTEAKLILMATTHWALQEFYDGLHKAIIGKYVIYEGIGDSLEERAIILEKLAGLESFYIDLFYALTSWEGMSNKLCQVSQKALELNGCKAVFFADESLHKTSLGSIFLNGDQEGIKTYLVASARAKLINPNKETSDLVGELNVRKREQLLADEAEQILAVQREIICSSNKAEPDSRIIYCRSRIHEGIQYLLSNYKSDSPQIAIVFGVDHMAGIAAMIDSWGWQCSKEIWHTVADVGRLKEL